MKWERSTKIAIRLALFALLPLGLLSHLLSKGIKQGGNYSDSACVVVTVLAVGYWLFVLVGAFRSLARKPGHLICVIWILGTFALHCWVLHELTHMPAWWKSVKSVSDQQTLVLNSMLTAYARSEKDSARARATMQLQVPRMPNGTNVPTVAEKLAIALKIEENQHLYLESVATIAEDAERLTARRAWVSWAVTAFTPVIVLALVARRTSAGRQRSDDR